MMSLRWEADFPMGYRLSCTEELKLGNASISKVPGKIRRKRLRCKNTQKIKIRDKGNSKKEVAEPGSGRTACGGKKSKPCGLESKSLYRNISKLEPPLCAPETLNQLWIGAVLDMH